MKWFKHDSDAHRDAKLMKVVMKYRAEGYALYWYCLELIAGDLNKDNITFELEHDAEIIGYDLGIDQLRVEEIIRYMVDLSLFHLNPETQRIVCLKLANRLDESASKNPEIRRVVNEAKTKGLINSPNKGFVYLIQSFDLHKIGKTKNIHNRLRDIKTTNPHATLIHTIETSDPSYLEALLHRKFAEKRADGEWFSLTNKQIDSIIGINDGDAVIQEGFPKVSGTDKNRLDEKRIDNNKPPKKFIPPSVDEVRAYCLDRQNGIDPDSFVDHYSANGWMRGKTKIKDWKACVRTWEKNKQPEQELWAGCK